MGERRGRGSAISLPWGLREETRRRELWAKAQRGHSVGPPATLISSRPTLRRQKLRLREGKKRSLKLPQLVGGFKHRTKGLQSPQTANVTVVSLLSLSQNSRSGMVP